MTSHAFGGYRAAGGRCRMAA